MGKGLSKNGELVASRLYYVLDALAFLIWGAIPQAQLERLFAIKEALLKWL